MANVMNTLIMLLPVILINLVVYGVIFYVIYLLIRALRKYLGSGKETPDTKRIKQSLGEALKAHRTRCGMTQEFVAEALGVSRQAVSKWENGTSDPTTSNLFALAKLYGISVEELLRDVER